MLSSFCSPPNPIWIRRDCGLIVSVTVRGGLALLGFQNSHRHENGVSIRGVAVRCFKVWQQQASLRQRLGEAHRSIRNRRPPESESNLIRACLRSTANLASPTASCDRNQESRLLGSRIVERRQESCDARVNRQRYLALHGGALPRVTLRLGFPNWAARHHF